MGLRILRELCVAGALPSAPRVMTEEERDYGASVGSSVALGQGAEDLELCLSRPGRRRAMKRGSLASGGGPSRSWIAEIVKSAIVNGQDRSAVLKRCRWRHRGDWQERRRQRLREHRTQRPKRLSNQLPQLPQTPSGGAHHHPLPRGVTKERCIRMETQRCHSV